MDEGRDPADGVETGTVRTNDVETYYVRRGDGPPIVFVHAGIMDHRMWADQMEALSDAFATVAYDVRGHGRTGGSAVRAYTADLYAADLHALLSGLDIERPVICGLSTGGCIAQAYAAAHPGNVAGLVLADTFTTAPLGPVGTLLFANLRLFSVLDRFVGYKRLNRLQLRVARRLKPGIADEGATVQWLVDEGPTIPHAEFRKIIDSIVSFPGSDLDLSVVDAPALIIYGENEPSFVRDHAGHMRERLSGPVEVVAIPDAGHASNIDRPEFFSRVVREFVEDEVLGR